MIDWSRYAPFITEAEMACNCGCGQAEMDPAFLDWLHTLRLQYDFPMVFTSAKRCADYNAKLSASGSRDGSHVRGMAVDIAINGPMAAKLHRMAVTHDAYGIGVRQHGPRGRRFLHIDRWPKRLEDGTNLAQLWSYDAPPLKADGSDV